MSPWLNLVYKLQRLRLHINEGKYSATQGIIHASRSHGYAECTMSCDEQRSVSQTLIPHFFLDGWYQIIYYEPLFNHFSQREEAFA
jgi:hypothetical protein